MPFVGVGNAFDAFGGGFVTEVFEIGIAGIDDRNAELLPDGQMHTTKTLKALWEVPHAGSSAEQDRTAGGLHGGAGLLVVAEALSPDLSRGQRSVTRCGSIRLGR